MLFRWRLWTRFKLMLRKRPVPSPRLPYELDEFAKLLSSRDPATLKQLATGLTARGEIRSGKLQA
jgi:CRISPR/Cas system endoribonuclease Cas6 (RAMP superfamily)